MKKFFTIGLAVLFMIGFATIGISDTTTDSYWSGSGVFETTFTAGDDFTSRFKANAFGTSGEFHGTDSDNNPYGYGVDNANSWMKASVTGAGSGSPDSWVEFEANRTDSKISQSPGPAGQRSYSFVGTDGSAEMAYKSTSNYYSMKNGGVYAMPKTTNGRSFEATGNHNIYNVLTDSDGDGAEIDIYGYGQSSNSKVRLFGAKSAGSSFNSGRLPVTGDGLAWLDHYADFAGSGTGDFYQRAWADNGLTIGSGGGSWSIPGDGTNDSATYNLHVGFSGNWSKPDLGISGN